MNKRSERKGETETCGQAFTSLVREGQRWKKRRETSIKESDGLLVIGSN